MMRQRSSPNYESTETSEINEPPTLAVLSTYAQLPLWQQDNQYIRSGYVRETLSYRKCVESLGYLHNESVNVYSHLIPALVSLILVSLYLPDSSTWSTKVSFYLFGFAITCCLGLSSSYHCVKTHSSEVDRVGSQCDYFGIVIMITFSLILVVNLALDSIPRIGFTLMFLILGFICGVLTLHQKFATPHYRPVRAGMFIIFGLSGTIPVFWSLYKWGYSTTYQKIGLNWLIREALFYIGGAVLYAAQFPERFALVDSNRGKFDIFGSSHQIFHFCVVIAAYCHWRALLECYKFGKLG